jgi:hypothetical protein
MIGSPAAISACGGGMNCARSAGLAVSLGEEKAKAGNDEIAKRQAAIEVDLMPIELVPILPPRQTNRLGRMSLYEAHDFGQILLARRQQKSGPDGAAFMINHALPAISCPRRREQ